MLCYSYFLPILYLDITLRVQFAPVSSDPQMESSVITYRVEGGAFQGYA